MSPWKTIRLVAIRELTARRRGFAIVTGLLATVAFGGMIVAAAASESGASAAVTGSEADEVMGYLTVIFLFLAIVFTGQVIMEGVAEEKRSRVVEVLLGTMTPRELLVGKVTAIGAMGLTEMLVMVFAVAGAGQLLDVFEVPRATVIGFASVIFWFIAGYAVFAALYAAAGAMVAPHENVANAAIPINLIVIVPYLVGVSAAGGGDSLVLQVFSIFPLTAPLTMPLRSVQGLAAPWEVAVAAVATLGTAYLLMVMAGRLYSAAIMRGGKVKWRDAWRASKGEHNAAVAPAA